MEGKLVLLGNCNFDYPFKLLTKILFAGETNDEAETDEDPLDSFMNEINKEVKKGKSNFRQMPAGAKKTGIVVGVKKTVNKIATAGTVQSKNGGSDATGPKKAVISKGAFTNYVDKFLAFF